MQYSQPSGGWASDQSYANSPSYTNDSARAGLLPSDRDENGRVVTKNVQVVTTITTTAKQVNIEIGSQ